MKPRTQNGVIVIVKKKYSLTHTWFFWVGAALAAFLLYMAVQVWLGGK